METLLESLKRLKSVCIFLFESLLMLTFLRKIIGPKNPLRFFYYNFKSFVAALIYGFPGKKIKVIGITGTDGKTTTANLITHLLNQSGRKTGLISTTSFAIGAEKFVNPTKRTSVSPFLMNRLLCTMLREKCEFAVLEVSSHALEQKRFFGVDFDIAVLTNITPEHLDYHKNLDEYRRVKSLLFQKITQSKRKNNQPKTIILNRADHVFTEFSKFKSEQKFSYALQKDADFWADNIKLSANQSNFILHFQEKKISIELPLPGEFNIENALASVAVVYSVGIDLTKIPAYLQSFGGVPGRMEKIEAGQNFNVIVDFALTPEALKKLFQTARNFTAGNLIGVFGCAGERDQSKRPLIGKIATEMLDFFILTDDETYLEDGAKIRNEIKKGISEAKTNWQEIPDRWEAIRFALQKAKKGDTVLITGMGCEATRNLGGREIEWDEREIVRQELSKL